MEERLERAVAEDVVGDLARDLPSLLAGEGRAVERKLLGDRPEHALRELFIRLRGEELRAELRDAGVVYLGLELCVGIGSGAVLHDRLTERRLAGVLDGGGRAVAVALDAVGKTHA